jgi:holo-[acyl-carrier protein] synthase
MHVVGLGTEIVECARIRRLIEQHGESFLKRAFTDREIKFCQARAKATEFFAAHWVAKEAVLKCLDADSRRSPNWVEVELRHSARKKPTVVLFGSTRELAIKRKAVSIQVSFSHCRNYATATAIAIAASQE